MGRSQVSEAYRRFCRRLGKELYELRTKNAISQTELGRRTGTGRTVISNYERGAQCPSLYQYIQLCNALEIPITQLV